MRPRFTWFSSPRLERDVTSCLGFTRVRGEPQTSPQVCTAKPLLIQPLVPLLLFSLNQQSGGSFKWSSVPVRSPRRLILCVPACPREREGPRTMFWAQEFSEAGRPLNFRDTPTYLPSCHTWLFPWVLETEVRSLHLCSSYSTEWVTSPTSRHQ